MIPVRIINDGVDEEDEQLLSRLQLEPVEGDSPNVQVSPNEAILVIVDDDGKYFKIFKSVISAENPLLLNFRNLGWL